MEIKNNKRSSKSFYVPLLLALLVIAGIVAVTTSFHEAASDVRKAADTASDVPVVATPSAKAENKDGGMGDKAETEEPAWMKEEDGRESEETTEAPEETEADVPAEPEAPVVPTFISPVSGIISKGFSADVPVFSETMRDYRTHPGVDVTAEAGEAVLAAADGMIGAVWDDPLMGKCMTIVHDGGFATTYKGLYEIIPEGIGQGIEVKAGQPIGAVGETALAEIAEEPHVHFEMTKDGAPVDPCSYVTFFATENYGE